MPSAALTASVVARNTSVRWLWALGIVPGIVAWDGNEQVHVLGEPPDESVRLRQARPSLEDGLDVDIAAVDRHGESLADGAQRLDGPVVLLDERRVEAEILRGCGNESAELVTVVAHARHVRRPPGR